MASSEDSYVCIGTLLNDTTQLERDEAVIRLKNWRVISRLMGYKWGDKELQLEIQPMRYQRSDAQNRYIWGVVVPTVQAFLKGQDGITRTKDAVYNYLNVNVLGREIVFEVIAGTEVMVMSGKRFSKMNTKEFSDAIETIIAHFDKQGCIIQLPKGSNTLNDFIVMNDR